MDKRGVTPEDMFVLHAVRWFAALAFLTAVVFLVAGNGLWHLTAALSGSLYLAAALMIRVAHRDHE